MTPPARAAGPAETADLTAAIGRLARASVLVVGDAMLDRYVYGAVKRVSPEAPVPILTVERDVCMPGGAGNVVRNLTALGAAVAFISVVGDDQAGSDLTGLIGGQPNVEPWLLVQGGRTTTTKTRYMARGQQLLRADHEVVAPIHPKLADRLLRITQDALPATSVAVLSDYGKGVLAGPLPAQIIAAAKAANRKVVVDPKSTDFSIYAGADIIVPNRRELGDATRQPVDTEAALIAAAQGLIAAHGFGAVLVTRAQEGMTLVQPGVDPQHFPAEATEVHDISGAGDTVVAALAAGMAAGLDLATAVRLANLAAGIVVGKIGTAVARDTDLLAALSPQGGALRKVVSLEQAAEQVERWRQRGWTVGYTTGCFDPLDPAQIQLLEQARGQCDRLVVGLDSDGGARHLNGAARQVQPEAVRAALLGGITAVDLVCIVQQDAPERLLHAIRPDLLMTDHAVSTVAGTDFVQSYGGRIFLAELNDGTKTTAAPPRLRTV